MPTSKYVKRRRCEYCGKAYTQITAHLKYCPHATKAIRAIIKAAENPSRPERKIPRYSNRKAPSAKFCPHCGAEFFTVSEHIRSCPGGLRAAAAAARNVAIQVKTIRKIDETDSRSQ